MRFNLRMTMTELNLNIYSIVYLIIFFCDKSYLFLSILNEFFSYFTCFHIHMIRFRKNQHELTIKTRFKNNPIIVIRR